VGYHARRVNFARCLLVDQSSPLFFVERVNCSWSLA